MGTGTTQDTGTACAGRGGPERGGPERERLLRTGRRRTQPDQRGITTAEYAVGTAAGAGLAGLLYQLLTGGFGDQLLRRLFQHVMGLLGI
jgi:hypothetical protein